MGWKMYDYVRWLVILLIIGSMFYLDSSYNSRRFDEHQRAKQRLRDAEVLIAQELQTLAPNKSERLTDAIKLMSSTLEESSSQLTYLAAQQGSLGLPFTMILLIAMFEHQRHRAQGGDAIDQTRTRSHGRYPK